MLWDMLSALPLMPPHWIPGERCPLPQHMPHSPALPPSHEFTITACKGHKCFRSQWFSGELLWRMPTSKSRSDSLKQRCWKLGTSGASTYPRWRHSTPCSTESREEEERGNFRNTRPTSGTPSCVFQGLRARGGGLVHRGQTSRLVGPVEEVTCLLWVSV